MLNNKPYKITDRFFLFHSRPALPIVLLPTELYLSHQLMLYRLPDRAERNQQRANSDNMERSLHERKRKQKQPSRPRSDDRKEKNICLVFPSCVPQNFSLISSLLAISLYVKHSNSWLADNWYLRSFILNCLNPLPYHSGLWRPTHK